MIRVAIDRGHWANQVRRLAAVMGQSIDEVLTGQAKLFVRDAMKFTPPFGDAPITEKPARQIEIGKAAIVADLRRMFRPASFFPIFTENRRASYFAKLAREGRTDRLLEYARMGGARNLSGHVLEATPQFARSQADRRMRYRKKDGTLVHPGTVQTFDWTADFPDQLPLDKSIRAVAERKMAMVGNAKAGWVTAAKALKVPVPGVIRRLPGASAGIYERRGAGVKLSITVGNRVRYMQGRPELSIIRRAWGNRQRNIEKQIANAIKARNRKMKAAA